MIPNSRILGILLLALVGCSEPPPAVGHHLPDGYVPDDPARTIFLGGAVTAGRGASDDDLAYPGLLSSNDSAAWPDAAGVDLRTLFPDLAEIHNVADDNPTVPTTLEEQLPQLEELLGDSVQGETLVVLTAGGKDLAAQEGTVGQLIISSDGKHATYHSIDACESAEWAPCLDEDCAPDNVDDIEAFDVLPPIVNAGEEASPRWTDLTAIGFSGDDAWLDQPFCGGQGQGGECSSSVRSKLVVDPFE